MSDLNPYSRLLTVEDLEDLDDAGFRKALIPNIWIDDRFAVFLEIEVVDQAYDVLKVMLSWTLSQFENARSGSEDQAKLGCKYAQMMLRLIQLTAEIERLNAEEDS